MCYSGHETLKLPVSIHLEKVRTVSTAMILGSALSKMDVTFWFMKYWTFKDHKKQTLKIELKSRKCDLTLKLGK